MERPTLSAAEVAGMLGLSPSQFYRRARLLRRVHGFPSPLPGLRRYSRAAVLEWIDSGGMPAGSGPPALLRDKSPTAILVERARAMAAA